MVFVSFSLPKETLQRIVSQAEKSGAVLVLRGLKGNSLTRMGEEIASWSATRNVTAIIHPPAFKQFKVRQVPALVLARSGQAVEDRRRRLRPGVELHPRRRRCHSGLRARSHRATGAGVGRCGAPLCGHDLRDRSHEQAAWLLLALLLASRVWAQGDAASSAFAEGKALGAGTIDSAFQGIGNGTGAATVPGFGLRHAPSRKFSRRGRGSCRGRVRPRSSTAPPCP
jgi:hypothetical protein